MLKGSILDATETGLPEIKGGSSVLDSTYQLRLQTYREGMGARLVSGRPMWVGHGFERKPPDAALCSSRTVRPDPVPCGHGRAWAHGLCLAYDPLGRTASEQWLAGESLVYTLQYTYDVGSRVTVAQDPLSRYSYVYNQNDQVTKVTSGNVGAAAVVLDSVYDLLGRRTELKATVAGKADFRNTSQYDPDHPSLPHPSRPGEAPSEPPLRAHRHDNVDRFHERLPVGDTSPTAH